MKHSAEYNAFTILVDRVMSMPHEEIKRRETEYQKQVDANPKRRGPKRKIKQSSASPVAGDAPQS
jgi:hypothetical protein